MSGGLPLRTDLSSHIWSRAGNPCIMYYQPNSFTGRLIGAHGMTPYVPLETPPTRKMSGNTIPGTNTKYGEVSPKLRLKMEHFQVENGIPVYIKGGLGDRLLFGFTLMLVGIGVALTANMYYKLAFKKG